MVRKLAGAVVGPAMRSADKCKLSRYSDERRTQLRALSVSERRELRRTDVECLDRARGRRKLLATVLIERPSFLKMQPRR
jgi:hypothetical protein